LRTYLECVPCLVRQTLEAARHGSREETVHKKVLGRVLASLARADLSQPPPVLGGVIHRTVREITGDPDPYAEAKTRFDLMMLELLDSFRRLVEISDSPLETAVRLAIAGNIIDFSVNAAPNSSDIRNGVKESQSLPLSAVSVRQLGDAVTRARNILYLGDNAGEIVLDRLLIEQLPHERLAFVVKGAPVINDVTLLDAETVGMSELVEVIDNGSDVPGTFLPFCSPSFRERFDRADLIISKGQGNYETLSEVPKTIFFLFKAKCPVITTDTGMEPGSLVLMKH
jgi:damage-control phosphatase, subfamily I